MRAPEFEPCFCCGKPVRVDRPHWRVHILTSLEVVPFDLDSDESQGTFAIGASCRKKEPLAVRCLN